MKVALVLPGSIWYAPYVRIYTKVLDRLKTEYHIVSWNRESDDKPEGFQYNVPCFSGHGSARWREYRGYLRFIKKTIIRERFDRIIVFGPQMTCILSSFLIMHFKGRYMIDYRDLSIEQRPGFKQLFAIMLRYSRANVISSPGFTRCLPNGKYFLSHNFDVDSVKAAISGTSTGEFVRHDTINVLTIGAIRDYSSNIEVVKALANKDKVEVVFVGKGSAAIRIDDYCKKKGINNVAFVGFYQKEDEASFVKNASFINIFYPRKITHDTALSNRFYNSLIYKKPMIVTSHTTQGEFVDKYNLGIALDNCDSLHEDLLNFIQTEDYTEYCKRCNSLLRLFLKDQECFESAVQRFLTD